MRLLYSSKKVTEALVYNLKTDKLFRNPNFIKFHGIKIRNIFVRNRVNFSSGFLERETGLHVAWKGRYEMSNLDV